MRRDRNEGFSFFRILKYLKMNTLFKAVYVYIYIYIYISKYVSMIFLTHTHIYIYIYRGKTKNNSDCFSSFSQITRLFWKKKTFIYIYIYIYGGCSKILRLKLYLTELQWTTKDMFSSKCSSCHSTYLFQQVFYWSKHLCKPLIVYCGETALSYWF